MIIFGTTFLLDYLDGEDATAEFLGDNEAKPFFAPTFALFEAYRGAAQSGDREEMERCSSALDWVEPVPFENAAAKEAALIETELRDAGEGVSLGDTLIAGLCRHHGGTLVTRGSHVDRVEGLDVEAYG